MAIKNVLIDKIVKFGFMLIVIVYHILPVAHIYLGERRFLGKNLIVMIPVMFIVGAVLFFFRTLSKNMFYLLVLLVLSYFFLTLFAIIFYDTDSSAFLARRFFIVPLLMVLLVSKLLVDSQYRSMIQRVFLVVILAQCSFGIIHNAFFPGLLYVGSDSGFGIFVETYNGGTRESGTMISASCYAYVLLSGMMVLAYVKELPWGFSQMLQRVGLQLYLFYGILLSGSRGPIILAALILASMLISKRGIIKGRTFTIIALILSVVVSVYFGFDEMFKASVIGRTVDSGSGGRLEKLMLVFSMLSQDIYMLVGVPPNIQATSEINGIGFSDNSFGTLLITFGATGFVLIVVLFKKMRQFSRLTHTRLPVVIGLICLSTTNSILWEPWIFYYLVAMTLIWFSTSRSFQAHHGTGHLSNIAYSWSP